MTDKPTKANINSSAEALRNIVLSKDEGQLLGSEDDLIEMMNVSRPTVRQVARLLEREGLLRVKRGINGGYFSARPSIDVIESSVSSYLSTVNMDLEGVTEIASALWMVAVKKMAANMNADSRETLSTMREKVSALSEDAGITDVVNLEQETRSQVFTLTNSPYIELIFHINLTFLKNHLIIAPEENDGTDDHRAFVQSWKRAKLLELETMMEGEVSLAAIAAKHSRDIIHQRLWG